MAKDRFSKFKKSNYSQSFRWGNNGMNHVGVGKREKLSDKQREFILRLIPKCSKEWDIKFLRSILVTDRVPTQKQKDILNRIVYSVI